MDKHYIIYIMKRIIFSTMLLFSFAFSIIAPISIEATDSYSQSEEMVSKVTNELFPTVEININGNEEFESDLDFQVGGIDQHIHYTAGFFTSEVNGEEFFRIDFEETEGLFDEYYWSVTPIDTPDWELIYESQRQSRWNAFDFWESYKPNHLTLNNDFKISIANIYEQDFSIILLTRGWSSLSWDLAIPVRFNVHINGDFNEKVYNNKEEYSAYINNGSLILKQKPIKSQKTLNQSFSEKSYENNINYFLESNFTFGNTKVHYSKKLSNTSNPTTIDGELLRDKLTGTYDLYNLKEDFAHSIIGSERYDDEHYFSQVLLPPSLWWNFFINSPKDYSELFKILIDFNEVMTKDFLNDPVNDWIYNDWYYDEYYKRKVPDNPQNRSTIKILFSLLKKEKSQVLTTSDVYIPQYNSGKYDDVENEEVLLHKMSEDQQAGRYELIGATPGKSWYLGPLNGNELKTSRKWIVDYLASNVSFFSEIKDEFISNMYITISEEYQAFEANEDIQNDSDWGYVVSAKSFRRIEINNKASFLSVPEILTLTAFIISIITTILLILLFAFKNIKEIDEIEIIMNENTIERRDE